MISLFCKRSGLSFVDGLALRATSSVYSIPKRSRPMQIFASVGHCHSIRYMGLKAVPNNFDSLQAMLDEATSIEDFFASKEMFPSFESVGIQNKILLERVARYLKKSSIDECRPSAVQAASFSAISSGVDVTIGAETGSGKTLAYLLPLIDDILTRKQASDGKIKDYLYARAVILVPNKELANQVLNMAKILCGDQQSVIWSSNGEQQSPHPTDISSQSDIVRLGILPGGLNAPEDYKPFRLSLTESNYPPLDLIITTPASLGPLALSPKNIELFADIRTVVIDEADMLFDGGYLRALENVLLGFKRADRLDASFGVQKTQHVLVAATLPDMGLKSVDAYVQKKFPYATRVTMKGMHNARHYGLKDQNVWIKDDQNEAKPKKKRMDRLIDMLSQTSNSDLSLVGEKVMIFLNSIEDVDSATAALQGSGINVVPFHAKLSLEDRTTNLNRFKKFNTHDRKNDPDAVSVLVCTDLAARGLDIPEVTAVVQLQFAGNVVTHLHRMGRCGRAGKRNGRGIIFYGEIETELVDVVRQAENEQVTMALKSNEIHFDDDTAMERAGKVQNAFSRKRGFTKKRKKTSRKESYEN